MKTGIKIGVDGNQIIATWEDFINLQDSPAGFGDNVGAAILNLLLNDPKAAADEKGQ